MAKRITLKSPDGKTIVLNAPDDATPEQINSVAGNYISSLSAGSQAQAQPAPTQPQEPSITSKVLNTAGDIGMGALKGAADIGSTIMQPIDYLRDNSGQMNVERRAGVKAGLESLGADTESAAFKGGDIGVNVASWVMPGMAATKAAQAGSILSKAGAFLGGEAPIKTAASMATGLAAGDVAKTSLKDNTDMSDNQKLAAEIAANIGGSLGASGVMGMAQMAGRTVPRLAGAVTGNVEGVAGRLINRAAGDQNAYIQSILESGKVPTIKNPIVGYAPRSSEIAGNAGISGLVRHAENNIMNSTALLDRNYSNQKVVKDFLQRKTAITEDEAKAARDALKLDANANAAMFRERDLPVDLKSVESELKNALARSKGNPDIEKGISAILSNLPKPEVIKTTKPFLNPITGEIEQQVTKTQKPVGFNEAYNFKQYIDEILSQPAMSGTLDNSIFKSKRALETAKKSLSNSLTQVEPEFAPFLKRQAQSLSRIERKEISNKIIEKASRNPVVSNQSGLQETYDALFPSSISNVKFSRDAAKMSEDQLAQFDRAARHLQLQRRTSSGMSRGSNTAQNLETNQLVMDDIIRGLTGDKANTGILSGVLRGLGKTAGNVPLLRNLSPISSRQAEISAIMAKAELDPKYMAELMKKYQALDAPIDPTVRGALGAALRSSVSQNSQ